MRGTWSIAIATDPMNQTAEDKVATITGTTFGLDRIPAEIIGNHMSLRFRSVAPLSATKPATLASAVVHFGRDDEEDS